MPFHFHKFISLSTSFFLGWHVLIFVLSKVQNMGRGVSAGGGQSSLGYLFGSGEAPKPSTNNAQAAPSEVQPASNPPPPKPAAAPQPAEINREFPAGINSTSTNNYLRADGQNAGNFITVWFRKPLLLEQFLSIVHADFRRIQLAQIHDMPQFFSVTN
jgi:SPIRAL1-like protein